MRIREPKISVVIPTYGHRDLITETLASVFDQTFTDFEVIVVNDGSPDDTNEILRPLIADFGIRYIEQENAGQAAARNAGIAAARGEFIALLDDDDIWPKSKLETQHEYLSGKPDVVMVAGNAQVVDSKLQPLRQTNVSDGEIDLKRLFESNPLISPGQSLIRADAIRTVVGFTEDIWGADDWDLYIKLASLGRLIMTNDIALIYRKHGFNASRDRGRMLINGCRVVASNIGVVPRGQRSIFRRKAYQHIFNYAGRSLISDACDQAEHDQFCAAARTFTSLRPLLIPILRDPRLCRQVICGAGVLAAAMLKRKCCRVADKLPCI